MSDKKAQLEISANSAPAEKAFERVKSSGEAMAKGVVKSGEQVDKALKGMEQSSKDAGKEFEDLAKKGGDGFKEIPKQAKPAADGVEKSAKSMIASVQRTTAALQAGERGSAKYFETLAQQRGIDPAVLKPYLDQLKAAEAQLKAVDGQQNKLGMSTKAYSAAMRGVPAQISDIAVSLQGGMSPMTVFMQQGFQLRDMFGGFGAAAKALSGTLVGMVNPLTVAGAAVGAVAVAYYQGSKEADEFRKALVTTGNAAGTSTNQLAALAEQMGEGFGATVGKAAEALGQIAATGQVGRASLQDFAATAIMAEKAFGAATADIAKNFADLGKDPVGASARLNESMNYLTASTYKQIQAAMDLGQESKAAALAQDAYNSALKGRSAEMLSSMGYIEKAWGGVKSAAKEAWDAMLGVGRPTTAASQIADVQKNLAASIEKRAKVSNDSAFAPALDKEIAKLKEQISYLGEIDRMQKRAGDSAAERVAKEQAGIQAQKDGLKYLSQEQKMRNEIAQQTATMRKAGMDEAAIQERIGQIKASYAKAGPNRAKEISEYEKLNRRIGEFAALQNAALEADGKLTEGQRLAVRVKQDMIAAGAKLSASDKERLQTALNAALATEQRLDAEKDLAKFADEAAKVQAKAADQADKTIEALKKQAAAEREATASIGLSKDAIAELTVAKYEDSAASKERMADTMAEAGESELLVKKYREEAAALRDLAKAKRERGSAEAASEAEKIATKAADKAAADWQKAADKIENSITDALMRGFESGKDFAQNLRDVLLNMFKTMVLRPQIQGIVSGGLGALGLGGPGQAAAGGLGGLGDMANMGINALGLGGAGAMFSSGVMSGLSAWGAGGSVTGLLGSGSALFSGGLASGLGTIAGALGPIALGLGALYMISKKLDTSGTIHTGGSASYSADAGVQKNISQSRTGFAFTYQREETTDMAVNMTKSIVGLLDLTAKSFGKSAGYSAATAFADDTSKDGAWGSLIISKGGKDLLNWADSRQSKWAPKTFADGEEGVKQYMAAVSKDVRDMLMQDTPGWADTMLMALGDSVTLDQLAGVVAQINAIQSTFVQFGAAMPQLASLSDEAVGSLLGLAGGIQNLQQGLGAYYDKFYSAAEKQAFATKRVSDEMTALGLSMPATNAQYRKLVEAQDLTTEAGRRQYAALIALAPAFDQVTAAAEQSTQRINQERERLELELLRAQGNTDELRKRERESLDASNQSLYDKIKALEDAKAAQERYTQAVESAQAALATALDRVQSAQNAVDAVRERGTSAYLSALSEVASLQEQIADQARQTAATYRDLAKQLREYVTGIVTPPSASFAQALTKALGGDREAMASLPGLATSATDQARNAAGSREEFAASQASILAGVLEAAAEAQRLGIETPAQAAQTLQQKLLAAQQKLAEATATANAIGAPLVAQQERLIEEYRKALAELADARAAAVRAQAALDAINGNTAQTVVMITDLNDATRALRSSVDSNFGALDRTVDGLLTLDELRTGLAGKATDQQITAMMNLLDTNNDGVISKLEASIAASNSLPNQIGLSLAGKFDALTASTEGLLKFDQFKTQFAGLSTDAELKKIFALLDLNNDGVISKLESLRAETVKLGTIIDTGKPVTFAANDPIRSVFDNISKTNNILTAQFVKWIEITSGSLVTLNKDAGTVSVSAITGFMTQTNRNTGAAGFPGQYVLQYDSTNYLMQIAASTALTAKSLDNLAFGHWSMLIRGFGPSSAVNVNIVGGSTGSGGTTASAPDYTNHFNQIISATQGTQNNTAGIASNISRAAAATENTYQALLNFAYGNWSMLIRGFGAMQSVPISFRREYTSTSFFATGGAFSNGIVTRPTAFNMGVMGEKTPEAIMPLANVGGSLGIRAQMPGTQDMLQALKTMQALMQRLQTVGETNALTSQDMLHLWSRMTRDGRAMPVAPSANDPLTVKVIA